MFASLHVHSHFSFYRGASSPAELVARAHEIGLPALALTDRDGLHAAVAFYQMCTEAGLQPIIGTEVTSPDSPDTAILLACNRDGYCEISHLLTRRHLEPEFELAASLRETTENVILLSHSPRLLEALATSSRKEHLYAEVIFDRPAGGPRAWNRLRPVVEHHRLPLVLSQDAHFARREDWKVHRMLRAIGENATLGTLAPSLVVSPQLHLQSEEQLRRRADEFPEACANTARIAERCRLDWTFRQWQFPPFRLPRKETPFSFLWKTAFRGLHRRYRPLTHEAIDRLKRELDVIDRLGFSPYFLIVWELVREARARGIPSLGRGSAANSLVSYCLHLTHVDPLRHNLPFERFLNPGRKSPPDIDLDFPWDRRDEVLEYVYDTYGRDRVAMISTTVRFAAAGAFREVAKLHGLSNKEIHRFTARFEWARADRLLELARSRPECRHLPLHDEPYLTIARLGSALADFPRHLSIHCGGIVVSPRPISDYTPLTLTPKGIAITQMDMYSIEELGLVKIDLLGNRSLSVLTQTVAAVREQDGAPPPVEDFRRLFRDEATRQLLREGNSIGCFYIESPAMRQLLRKLEVETFEVLTAASSVIRPGVAESGMMDQFIRRHRRALQGEGATIDYLHPVMRELLAETYGVMIYQEDVIKVAHQLAGMSLAEADLLRRAMSGKERSSESMLALEQQFLDGCLQRGVDEETAREVWRQVASFACYAFCKAHSASFALLSFQVAYLKAHYPAAFLAAVLSNEGGFYHPAVYVEEARRLGIRLLLPDVNRSDWHYTGRDRGAESAYPPKPRRRRGELRLGFMAIKGFPESAAEALIEERRRRHGFFVSLGDLLRRVGLRPSDLEKLILCGALDGFELSRPEMLWRLGTRGASSVERIASGSVSHAPREAPSLFPSHAEQLQPLVPRLAEYSLHQRCVLEWEHFGFPLTCHPLTLFEKELAELEPVAACDMDRYRGRSVRMVGWLIAAKRIVCRKSGEPMKFMSVEDRTGTFEVSVFPRVYRRYAPITVARGPYLFTGRVEAQFDFPTLVAERIELLRLEGKRA